jgi:hypothetical protein
LFKDRPPVADILTIQDSVKVRQVATPNGLSANSSGKCPKVFNQQLIQIQALFRFYPIAQHFEGLTMIRRAPSKKHKYVVLLFPKGWKSMVGVLTIFCQRCLFLRYAADGDLQVETNLIDLSCTETAQQWHEGWL